MKQQMFGIFLGAGNVVLHVKMMLWKLRVLMLKPVTLELKSFALFAHDWDALIREPNPMPVESKCSQCLSLCNRRCNTVPVIDKTNKLDIYNGTAAEIPLCTLHSTSKRAANTIFN